MDQAAQNEIDLASGHLAALLTRNLPDLVQSLSLVGSAVDGDYRPGRSDLDFVAVLAHPPTQDELEGLAIVHRLYRSDPTLPLLGGVWLLEPDLAAGPDEASAGPATEDGEFLIEARGSRNPVTWFDLHDRSRPVLGNLDRARVWRDPARLRSWTCENVEAYWLPWLDQSARLTTKRGLAMLGRGAPMWGVLGISRLHATLATGAILSKTAAGAHARAAFGEAWFDIVEECLSSRAGGRNLMRPLARRRRALDFVAMAIVAIRAYCASE